jgi:predicted membrane protein
MRAISLAMAVAVTITLLGFPYIMGRSMTPVVHALLPLLLMATSGAFVHGLGYIPEGRWWRVILGPPVIWPTLLACATLLAVHVGGS